LRRVAVIVAVMKSSMSTIKNSKHRYEISAKIIIFKIWGYRICA